MKNTLFVFLFLLCYTFGVAQTSYVSHRVQKGETVFSITKQYNISEDALMLLNPEVKNGLKTNSILIIPADISLDKAEGLSFQDHKVKRKETLFSIAKEYGVSVDVIKKYNKHLYAEQLKKGSVLKIPVKKVTIVSKQIPMKTGDPEKETREHLVAPKETKFGIARKYNITIPELEELNPGLKGSDSLPEGATLRVPNLKSTESAVLEDEKYTFYEVQPKEGFYRLKKKFNLEEAEIVALNPNAKDGLKEGMILKLPKEESIASGNISRKAVRLEEDLKNFRKKQLVVVLPFQLQHTDLDSTKLVEKQLMKNAAMRIALDFYSGVLMAADLAKEKGIGVDLHVLDTEQTSAGIRKLFKEKNIDSVDAVIGPLRQKEVERVAAELEGIKTPVLSPLSNLSGKMRQNFVQSIPEGVLLENRLLSYVKEHYEDGKLLLIADKTRQKQLQKIQKEFPDIVVIHPREGNYFRTNDIADHLSKERKNWVILESTSASVVSNAVSILNSLKNDRDIRLFTTDRNDAFEFENVSNMHLAKLGFTFPSVSKTYDYQEDNLFLTRYQDHYGFLPNRYAVRGFDVTYDTLLRLAFSETLFETNDTVDGETVYIENKFFYEENGQGGYSNTAVYLLQYTPDLTVEEVR